MALTQKDTKTLVKEVVKALDPKFSEMSLEIGEMFNDVHGDAAVFQSRMLQRFDDVDEKLQEQDSKFKEIIGHVKGHSTQLRNHEARIAALEKK